MNKKFIILMMMCLFGGLIPMNVMAQEVTIDGDNNYSSQFGDSGGPFEPNQTSSSSQNIYLKEEIGNNYSGKKITHIAFNISAEAVNSNYHERTITVWLSNTEDTDFGVVNKGSATKVFQDTKVFQGKFDIDNSGWVTIDIDDEFTYTGNNLVVTVYDNTGGKDSGSGNTKFNMFKSNTNNANYYVRTVYRANTAPVTGMAGKVYTPCIQLTFEGDLDVTLTSPENKETDVFNPSLDFTLSGAKNYDVYLGTSENNLESVSSSDNVSEPSFQTNNLTPNTTYYWKVVAKKGTNAKSSDVYSFTTRNVTEGPGALTNVRPADGSSSDENPLLSWTFGKNTEEQQLLIDNVVKVDWTNIGAKESDQYQTSNLSTGKHTWQVNTKNSAGTTTGTVYSFTKLGAPNNVTPISPADGETGVTSKVIRWQFADNTTKYRFLFSTAAPENEDVKFDETFQYWNGTNYQSDWLQTNGAEEMEIELKDSDFKPGTTYYWIVDVKNTAGTRMHYGGDGTVSIHSFTTTDVSPVTLSTNNGIVTNGSANLSWTYGGKNAATHYQVYWGKDENNLTNNSGWLERSTAGTDEPNATDSYTITESLDNAVYYWRVDVKKDEGEAVSSEVRSFVNGLSISVSDNDILSNESTTVSWNAIAGATSYNVYVDSNEPINTENNSYELSGLTSGEHTISVKAVYNNEESFASNEVTVNVTAVGTLSITVKDSEGNPIEGATVTLNESTTQTDANGSVSIENLVAGTYEFTVSKDLYDIHTEKDVVINENATTAVNVTLLQSIPDDVTPISPENEATDVYRPTLSWNFAPNTTHYRVLVKGSYKVGGTDNWIETGGAEEGEYEITDQLDANTVYEWCVDVKNARGSRALYSGDADVAIYTFTTSPIAEVNYTAPADNSVTASSEVTLTWNYRNNNEADEYQVLYGTTNPPTAVTDWTPRSTETIADVVSLKMTDSYTVELSVNTKYYWQINVRKGEVVREGAIWSFVTPMDIPENVSVPYTEILPVANQNYGTTTVSWDELSSGAKYNVYVDGNKHNANPIEATSYDITELSIGTHTINVTAVYEGVGESEKSDVLDVTVVENSAVDISVKNINNEGIGGAEVTLTHPSGQSYNLTLGNTGTLNVKIGINDANDQDEKYTVTVTKDKYDSYEGTFRVNKTDDGQNLNITLESEYVYTVSVHETSYKMLTITIGTALGNYNLYIKKDNDEPIIKGQYFAEGNGANAEHKWTDWKDCAKGTYRFGVANMGQEGDVIINWAKDPDNNNTLSITRNHIVFSGEDGNWTDNENWDPNSSDCKIYIESAITIEAEDEITVEEINLVKDDEGNQGSLNIYGSLTVNGKFVNGGDESHLVLHDGAQLRRNSTSSVKASHEMGIINPTEWTAENKTGWQFISSAFTNAEIANFTNVGVDNYDLYKYVGTSDLEWVNEKVENGSFDEDAFVQGRAYLASYKESNMTTLKGTLNDATSFRYENLSYDENKDLAKFNLIGNPFPFDMDWSKVKYVGLSQGYATVNDGAYEYHATGIIPMGDGFFVKTTREGAYISYNDNSRSRSEQNDYINVIASNKSGKDNVIINFAGSEEEGFTKLNNFNDEIANIFITENDKRYGIVNYDRDVKEVELNFIASQMGSYSIKIEPSGEFDYIVLVDKQTGIETNMLLEDEYRFTATNNDKYDRFVLKLSYANNNSDDENSSFVYQSGEDLIIDAEGTIQIIDVIGRVVYEDQVESTNNRISISNLNKSTYVVRSINENGIRTQKIVIL